MHFQSRVKGVYMKNKIISFILMVLAIIELILMKDSSVVNLLLNSLFVGFFLITFINNLFKKESKIGEKYLLFLIFINIIVGIISIFTDSILMGLYNTVLGIMSYYLFSKLFQKDKNVNKLLVTVYVLHFIPILLLESISYYVVYSLVFRLLVVIYFALYIKAEKRKFKLYEWVKHVSIICAAIIYIFFPVIGGLLAAVIGFLSFGGAFEIYDKRREDALYNRQVKRNEIFVVTKKIYHYAPNKNEFFNKQIEDVGKKTFLEEEIPYELYAIMDEIECRKNEELLKVVYDDKDDLINRVVKLIDAKIRPELICYMLMEGFRVREDIKDVKKKKIYEKVEKVMNAFEKEFIKCVEDNNTELKEKEVIVNNLYERFGNDLMKTIDNIFGKIL